MTKHGHGLPRKRPDRSAKDEIADDLPILEPLTDDLPTLQPLDGLEELPTLEAVEDDGPVRVTAATGAAGESGFDTTLTVDVPEMEKKQVADAVRGPLTRAVGGAASDVRHRRVLVRFTGAAMIGSAVKDLVTEVLTPHKPLLAMVRRGFGDETVLQGRTPTATVTTREEGGTTSVEVETGELDAADLPIALATHVEQWSSAGKGKRYAFVFRGSARPDAALRTSMTAALRAAGVLRAAIGERVLFDCELEDMVRCKVEGDTATLRISPAANDAAMIDALAMVLPSHKAAMAGKAVVLTFESGSGSVAARDFCIEFARKAGAVRVLMPAAGGLEVLWPPLLSVAKGNEVTVRLDGNGRTRASVLSGLRREGALHANATKGQPVVVDWPAGFVLDGEAEACLLEIAPTLAARSLACTIAGDQREPFLPEPVSLLANGGQQVLRIDSEAGKPIELQRALDRRFVPRTAELRGKAVCVQIAGSAALSRTLLRSVLSSIEAAGAMRLELQENDTVDVLLPPLLTIAKGAEQVRIVAVGEGRNADQQARALQRELAAAMLPAGATISVGASAMAEAVILAVVAAGASRVVLDGPAPVLVHPPLFGKPDKKGASLRVQVQAANEATMVARQLDRELAAFTNSCGSVASGTVTIVWPGVQATAPALATVVAAFAAKKPAKVLLDAGDGKPVQVHPPVAAATVPAPAAAAPTRPTPASVAAPSPAVAPATAGTNLISLLGRRDEAMPPMILLGVEAGTEAAHVAAVESQLQEHLPRFRGRAVLLVPRRGNDDVPVRKPDELVDALRRLVPTTAAATLVFRGPDAQGRPHFQVLHSTVRAMPVGGVFADPRSKV